LTAARIRLVAKMGSAESTLATFFILSFMLHLAFAVGVIFMPDLRSRPSPMISTMPVSLVAAVPTRAPAQQTTPEATPEQVEPVEAAPQPKTTPPDTVQAVPETPPKPSAKPVHKKKAQPKPQAAAPADIAGIEESAAPGLTAGLTGMGSEFDWYREAVNRSLYTSWRQPILQGLREPLEVEVYFEILQNGTIRGLRIESSSGLSTLDRSVLRAVQEALLPPLPRSFRKPTQEALITFQYFPDDL